MHEGLASIAPPPLGGQCVFEASPMGWSGGGFEELIGVNTRSLQCGACDCSLPDNLSLLLTVESRA